MKFQLTLALSLCLLASCGAKSSHQTVRIALLGPGLQTWCLPVTLAQSLGFYQDEGLAVELESLPSAPKALQALLGGSVDVAVLSYIQNIQMAAEGQPVRSFFIMDQRDSKALVVAPSAQARIHRIEDLKGAMVGVSSPGATTHLYANYILAAHGVLSSAFSPINIGTGASAIAAVESGRIDAASLTGGDHFHLLKRHPNLRVLVDGGTLEGMRVSYGDHVFATGAVSAKQDWLNRNPDTARRLTRALLRSLQWVASHKPEEILARLPDSFRSPDPTIDLEIIRWGQAAFTPDGKMPTGAPEGMRRYLDATVENVRHSKIDLATTWTNEYLPNPK